MRVTIQLLLLLFLGSLVAPRASALEVNYWPAFTGERDGAGHWESRQMLGPLLFWKETEKEEIQGFRPLFVSFAEKEREAGSFHFLYPVFNLRHRPYGTSWDLFTVLRFQSFTPEEADTSRTFHLFPILFWGSDPDPEKSYFGIFPIAGSAHNTFTYHEVRWFLFPLTARLTRGEVETLAAPWPFLRFVSGPDTSGFHLWPLYGQVKRENVSNHRYWLWPLGYKTERELWKEQPFEAFGFLPLYTYSRSDRAMSRSFLWPFFGYTTSWNPEYQETRYFWPLLVQRRGESYINRWAPVYTRSIRLGQDTRWILWPLHRHSTWDERGLLNERTQFLYFLYWSQVQSSIAFPELPSAIRQHVWPFYSYWDNGAGRRQFQTLSPFEVFFPFNEVVREKYSPLFAVYRLDVEEGVHSRQSFLFNLITTRREVEEEIFVLNIGPLLSYEQAPETREWEILHGLLSYSHGEAGRSFGAFWLNRPGGFRETGDRGDPKTVFSQPRPRLQHPRPRGPKPRRVSRSRS